MSDDNRKMNKQQSTGTVPRIKCRNNRSTYSNGRDSPRSWTSNNTANNLSSDFQQRLNLSDYLRNSRRNSPNLTTMNTSIEEQNLTTTTTRSINGSITPSSSTSRRNSGAVPKCDNITKYPDKKQIEDKLSQIREYLQITTSLMSTMKSTDEQTRDEFESMEQMVKDLKDSERKLVDILESMNETATKTNAIIAKNEQVLENGLDICSEPELPSNRNESDSNRDLEILREQQMSLLSLQQKAENKLRDARQIQEKLFMSQHGNSVVTSNQRDKNFAAVDAAIRELEESTKRLNETKPTTSTTNLQDKLMSEVDTLHNQIIALHNVNEDRNQLIQVLDNRDQELRAQHDELQTKLSELHNRKQQVDQLVSQLHNLEDGDEDDVATQVKKIVTMKDQLTKLKDMLEIVKTTESIIQNTNATQEEQDLACGICTKAENFLQKTQLLQQNDSNVMRSEPNRENRTKQINKNAATGERQQQQQQQQSSGTKPRVPNKNKLSVKAELEARKRELEELMGKHKAGTSNLNHDVGVDNKSEFSCSSNTFYDTVQGWTSTASEHNRFDNSDRYSSDECPEDVNEYTEENPTFTLPLMNYPQSKSDNRSDHNCSHIQDDQRVNSRISNRNCRNRTNSEQTNKTQVQKQLELIRSVCDSMLEQQQQPQPTLNTPQNSNVQQLRNNLTPSPLYSEPRRFTSPNPQSMNVLNVVNPLNEWYPNMNNTNQDPNNYQGWLATNTLQTQAFMMNTLNQCCQMLWLQQRELASLRLTVNQLQERVENPSFDNPNHLTSPLQQNCNSNNNELRPNQCRSTLNQQKTNQQHVSSACSMPNLNQYNLPNIANIDPNYNQNNARLLDPCLNNSNLNPNDPTINNSVLQQTAANINHPLWNGQALNNQVAPGNRANNYWDNFRSYSRQNLLSTKSNDGLQSTSSNVERTNPFQLISTTATTTTTTTTATTKCNSEQTSMNSSHETTPQRRSQLTILRQNNENRLNLTPLQPDVLNVNHNLTKIETNQRSNNSINNINNNSNSNNNNHSNNLENDNSYQMYINNAFGGCYNETSSNNSNLSEEHIFKDCLPDMARRRNEWHDDEEQQQNNDEIYHPKSKLFEELRENVYKEVVTLISANEARPHFLIQLFRDLQMISSDPLRLKILQSIQTIITQSLITSTHLNVQGMDTQSASNDQNLPTASFSLQSTVWSKSIKNPSSTIPTTTTTQEIDTIDYQNTLKDILPFLNDHEDDIISHHFLNSLKQNLIDSETFQETVHDTAFQKHFSNVLDEVLNQFIGKKAADVKMLILQSINELLRGELSFIQLIQDTCPNDTTNDHQQTNNSNLGSIFTITTTPQTIETGQIENGDLAEADQGRVDDDDDNDDDDDDDTEEEGAVGGFWDHLETTPLVLTNTANSDEVTVSTLQYQNSTEAQNQFSKQGLDQVPIRLPTKSRSNTPNKDRSASRSDHQEQF